MTPSPDEWADILEAIDADEPPAIELAERFADARGVSVSAAQDAVEAGIEDGTLIETDAGSFGGVRVADQNDDETAETAKTGENDTEEPDTSTATPTFEGGESADEAGVERWKEVDFAAIDPETWAPGQIGVDAWMCREETKAPYAPWADADAPVECSHEDHDEATTCDECRHHAGYKWGSDGSREHVHGDHEIAREWADMHPGLSSDLVFIQRDADPFAFVDGDDVRDPETGEIHPVFEAILEHLGVTYADVSTSGGGVHAVYRGEIPLDGVPEAKFEIDTEPWGENNDPPAIEIYDGKHVCIATGDHLAGTGTEIVEWDDDALADILRANGYEERSEPSADTSVDLEGYEPTATGSDETTDDIRDIFRALDRLDPKRVGERTIVSEWTRARRSFLPTWGSSGDNGTANYIDDRIWHDTGHDGGYGGPAVMAAIDAGLINHRGAEPSDVSGETFFKALDHLRELGFSIPRLESSDDTGGEDGDTQRRELLALDVVVEPANALGAAAAVEPDDLDEPLPELERNGVNDVAIAVALAEGMINSPDEFPDNGGYTEAYYRARDHYGAPLPRYLDNSTLEERADLVFAAVERLQPEHILEGCRSEVTVDDPSGEAIAKLDPTWEDSESGERILAGYGKGFYCVEHGVSFSPIQLAAIENGLTYTEDEYPRGEAFKEAYRILREEYGAPLPKWRATVLEHVAVLPPAARVLGGSSADRSLEKARDETEAMLRNIINIRKPAQLVTNLPGTGKTFSTAIVADENPILYATPRNELKEQIETYAAEIRANDEIDAEPTVRHLPILAENQFDEVVIGEGIEAVREHGRRLLRDRGELFDAVDTRDEDDEDDEDAISLNRPTCPTAEGEHGEEWALALQVARGLEHKPVELHTKDTALFGEELPCQHDGDCPFSLGWEAVRNADESADILVGSPGHAFVDSATTYFDRGPDGKPIERSRAVVIDEFPDDTYASTYGDRYLDFATWIAESLTGVDTREDLLEAGLDNDTWVNLWLDGDGHEYADVSDVIDLFNTGRKLCEARQEAGELLSDGFSLPAPFSDVIDALETLRDGTGDEGDLETIRDTIGNGKTKLSDIADTAYATGDRDRAGKFYTAVDDLDGVFEPLAAALEGGADTNLVDELEKAVDALPVGGDLRSLLEDAVEALHDENVPDELLDAAVMALKGGRDGCQELAIYADDGYAHPDAWALLAGAIARDATSIVETETFAFDGDEGGTFKRLTKNDATIVADKNHHGSIVIDTPAFSDITGNKCPVIGLDATGRAELWKIALGRDVQRRDIHDSDAERRGFLRDNGYAVVQTTNDPLPYHSDPQGKNFNEDLELVKTVTEEYTGAGVDAIDDKGPAVISTLKVINHLEDELDQHAGATVNYENMKGSDALGNHQTAVILGSQHYGDAKPEKWGLLAGEDAGRGDTRGDTLDYGSDVANAYLRYMREDHTMQAILRAGRNNDDTVIFAHTSALRDDLPTVDEGVVLSVHSNGALAVAEAAKEYRTEPFTANDIAEAIADDDRAVGPRQVRNVLADLRESGYLRVVEEGGPGVGFEYEIEEDPGRADVELPEIDAGGAGETSEISGSSTHYTWNFRSEDGNQPGTGMIPPSRATIPAREASGVAVDGRDPPS